MFRCYRLLLHISIFLGALQGCDSDTQTEQIFNNGDTIPIEITMLNSGEQPLKGNVGIKKMAIIDNETDFVSLWYDYTNDNIPTINFQDDIVVLYDMGGERNADTTCGNTVSLSNLSAEQIDKSVSLINMNLFKDCPLPPDIACLAVFISSRPYIFASIPRNSEVLLSEKITFEKCS